MQKITIKKILKKKNKLPIACLTAYTKNIAKIADKYCDIILVGDSLGMVLYGMKTTRDVKIETMILHAKTVKSITKRSLVVFDMPYKTYTNKFSAYKNAKKVIKLTKCDAIKLEGGAKIFIKKKNIEEGEINLKNVLLLNPQNDEAIYMLTLIKIEQSDYNEAKELINKFNLVCKSFCSKKKEIETKFKKLNPENAKNNN